MKVTVGLAQIAPSLGDIAANLDLHLATAARAAAEGIDLLVFPELSLTGYHLRETAFDVALRASADDPVFARLLEASALLDMVVSFVEVDERQRHHIAAAYLSEGQLVHLHRKVYLPTYGLFDEGRYFGPGQAARAFDTRFGRMGLLVCEDFWHASLPYLLWQDGADILLLISASLEHGLSAVDGTSDRVVAINRAYALLFTTFVIHVNRTGEEEGGCFWGGSTIFGPRAELIVAGPAVEPALVTAEIDTDDLREARRDLPLLRDERPELTARELARILNTHD